MYFKDLKILLNSKNFGVTFIRRESRMNKLKQLVRRDEKIENFYTFSRNVSRGSSQ